MAKSERKAQLMKDFEAKIAEVKIGRASCRERV